MAGTVNFRLVVPKINVILNSSSEIYSIGAFLMKLALSTASEGGRSARSRLDLREYG